MQGKKDMRKITVFLLFSLFAVATAAVKPGENILTNGKFSEVDENGTPDFWVKRIGKEYIRQVGNGGPGDGPFMRFEAPENGTASGQTSLRQYGLTLKEGETYIFSAWVRTRNFNSPHAAIGIINFDWYDDIGIKPIPANQDWTHMKMTFKMLPSRSGTYVGIIFAHDFTGTLDVADFRVEAVSDGALANSEVAAAVKLVRRPRLVAEWPILYRIPSPDTPITFRFYGEVPEGNIDDYDVVLETPDKKRNSMALVQGENKLRLPEGALKGDLYVRLVKRGNGKVVFSDRLEYAVTPPPVIDTTGHRRLNNFVTELLHSELPAENKSSELTFFALRNGWIYISIDNAGATVRLDNSLSIITKETPRQETFRRVTAGKHVLGVDNAAGTTSVTVRSIPEIFNYCPGKNSGVTENPPYDWDFQERFVLPAMTTYDGGEIAPENIKSIHARGYYWVGNLNSRALSNDADVAKRLERSRYVNTDDYDGAACDEQVLMETEMIERYAAGIKMFRNHKNKMLYSWMGGTPKTPVDAAYFSACINASRGDGLMLMEIYTVTKGSAAEAESEYLKQIKGLYSTYNNFWQNADKSMGIILGAHTQIPILSIQWAPQVDFKAHFDMQVRQLATGDFNSLDIPCVGCWGSYYAEEEHHRWIFKVFRHYCIEGKTNSLADEYGYKYLPGTIVNCNFDDGLNGWQTNGNVSHARMPSFGNSNMGMLGAGKLNECLAVLAKNENGAPSRIMQTIRNLVPGRKYCLQFVTCDTKDVKSRSHNPRRYGIEALLEEGKAKIHKDLSWVFVDERTKGRFSEMDKVGRINLHHCVFTPNDKSLSLTFDNAAALPGEELGVTFVTVNPFFSRED